MDVEEIDFIPDYEEELDQCEDQREDQDEDQEKSLPSDSEKGLFLEAPCYNEELETVSSPIAVAFPVPDHNKSPNVGANLPLPIPFPSSSVFTTPQGSVHRRAKKLQLCPVPGCSLKFHKMKRHVKRYHVCTGRWWFLYPLACCWSCERWKIATHVREHGSFQM